MKFMVAIQPFYLICNCFTMLISWFVCYFYHIFSLLLPFAFFFFGNGSFFTRQILCKAITFTFSISFSLCCFYTLYREPQCYSRTFVSWGWIGNGKNGENMKTFLRKQKTKAKNANHEFAVKTAVEKRRKYKLTLVTV